MARLTQTFTEVQNILDQAVNGTLPEYYNKTQIHNMISGGFAYRMATALPGPANESTMNQIYLIPTNDSLDPTYNLWLTFKEDDDTYTWYQIGNTAIDIDQYYKKETQYNVQEFSTSTTYHYGDYVYVVVTGNDSCDIYKCIATTASGSWTAANWENVMEDNSIYNITTGVMLNLPALPNDNKQGITFYLTASGGSVSVNFPSGHTPLWFGDEPDAITIDDGDTAVFYILDGIFAFTKITTGSNS